MKIFVVGTIAQPVGSPETGVFIRLDRAFTRASKADVYSRSLAKTFKENIPVMGVGPVACECQRGVWEVEMEQESAIEKEINGK